MKLLSRNPDKPKKKLESTIGKIIYGFLLFAPLLSILVTCMYVTFNKNAYESYSGNVQVITDIETNYKYETNEVNTIDDLVEGNIYHFEIEYTGNLGFSVTFLTNFNEIYNSSIDITSTGTTNQVFQSTNVELGIGYTKGTFNIVSSNPNYTGVNMSFNSLSLDFVYRGVEVVASGNYSRFFSKSEFNIIESYTPIYEEVKQLDNAFEYSTTKVENSTLYNWAKNTGTYEVVHNTTQLLGIENTFIPMLMAYWLLISVIYFIYDIALMLIMVVHRKIHELQESI